MKNLILSDVVLETLKPYLQNNNDYEFRYSEDIVLAIKNINTSEAARVIIHLDNNFKKRSNEVISDIFSSIINLAENSTSTIIISNGFMLDFPESAMKVSAGYLPDSILRYEKEIKKLGVMRNVFVLDFVQIVLSIGREHSYNYQFGLLYQMPYTKKFLVRFAGYLSEFILKLDSPDKKVIVLDCDNSLWRGIVGEDGLESIGCDLNGTNKLFFDFQRFLLTRKQAGFLLCLCSKNNYNDVKDAFDKRNFPLRWDDFAVKMINWEDKALNIQRISDELNLGLESFIFVDDSDFEVNLIKESLPSVTAVKFLAEQSFLDEIFESLLFSKKIITDDDKEKSEQYKQEDGRKNILKESLSLDEYIAKLNIQLDVKKNDINNVERISQLTEKTNQFNFNKVYYTPNELIKYVNNGEFSLYSLSVTDNFGSYGIVGLIIIRNSYHEVVLENFIMSCRALGRKIEEKFIQLVKNDLALNGKKINKILFYQTNKNQPAFEFKEKLEKIVYE